jgi:hypothetical protein
MTPGRVAVTCRHCGKRFLSRLLSPGVHSIGNVESCSFCGQMNDLPDGVATASPGPYGADFLRAKRFPMNYQELASTFKTPVVAKVASSFVTNVYRLHNLIDLPAFLVFMGTMIQRHISEAEFDVLGTVRPGAVTAEQVKQIESRFRELMRTHQLSRDDLLRGVTELGEANLPGIIQNSDEFGRSAFEAILINQLTGAWTAFESIAGDLWEAAINVNPARLALLGGAPNRIKRISQSRRIEPKAVNVGDMEKQLSLPAIARRTKGSFDIRQLMGTLLKGRFNFSRLDGIREAYSSAFDKKHDEIDKVLADTRLDALGAVRNLHLHRGGVVDEEYLEIAKTLPTMPTAPINSPTPLNGAVVGDLAGPVLDLTVSLLRAVDEWLASAIAEPE